ncbi:hypothetical protein L7F22_061170 [Adiantum nelumboides]|nr:hypothetical protein [Adiantum nelumboides]
MASSKETKNPFELKIFDGNGFNLWKKRIEGLLFLKDCDLALEEDNPEDMSDVDWARLNKKAITYIKIVVIDGILVKLKDLATASAMWEKLRSAYENKTPINQVHLMCKLVNLQADESKRASEHLSTFLGILSQLLDTGLLDFEGLFSY